MVHSGPVKVHTSLKVHSTAKFHNKFPLKSNKQPRDRGMPTIPQLFVFQVFFFLRIKLRHEFEVNVCTQKVLKSQYEYKGKGQHSGKFNLEVKCK